MPHPFDWYRDAIREIREAFEGARIGHDDAIRAVEEVARILGEDAELRAKWGTV